MVFVCRKININEMCNVERAVPGKVYKSGTCFVKLSAVDEFVGQLKEPGTVDNRFAVLEPKQGINNDYLFIAVERAFPEFLRRYRTTINLQFETLSHFVLDWHEDEEQQRYVVSQIQAVNAAIRLTEQQVAHEQEMRKWYLAKMMV